MPTLFVVISLPRTGTHMLRTLLNQHPNIRTETELFNEDSKGCRKWRKKSAQWVLDKIAWPEDPKQIRGFMLHLCHGHSWKIWEHLLTLPNVRYLCLRRFNLLEQYLSLQQALVHKQWQTYRDDPCPPVRPMAFQPEPVKKYFSEMLGYWDRFELGYADRPQHTVWYEDLCSKTDAVSKQAQEFLGAEVMHGLEPDTIKVGRPAEELISNYAELRECFAGSPYACFFNGNGHTGRRSAA